MDAREILCILCRNPFPFVLFEPAFRQPLQPMVVFLHGDIDPCAALIVLNQPPDFTVDAVYFCNQFFLAEVSGDFLDASRNLVDLPFQSVIIW